MGCIETGYNCVFWYNSIAENQKENLLVAINASRINECLYKMRRICMTFLTKNGQEKQDGNEDYTSRRDGFC